MTTGLLESESTGGATARVGFEYQDAFALQHIPLWLSQGAFSHVVSEAVGDIEVCYFSPDGAPAHVLHEAKDFVLNASQFWEEILRFHEIFQASPLEFPRFVLVCRDFNRVVAPLVAKLSRLRGVGAAFSPNSVILSSDRAEVITWVVGKGQTKALAEFILDHVEFTVYASEHADQAFAGELARHLHSIDIGTKRVMALRDKCKGLIAKSSFGPVYRLALESALEEALGDAAPAWRATPTKVHTGGSSLQPGELALAAAPFNGPDRGQRTAKEWSELAASAARVGVFLTNSRARKCIALDGKQRMSVACLLGYIFGATPGHVLQVEHNGQVYRTDDHRKAEGAFFNEDVQAATTAAAVREGVACIGFPTPVGQDAALAGNGQLYGLAMLNLTSGRAIGGTPDLNLAVAEAKSALVRFRSAHRLELLHLLVKAPSVFSMALGHRLNGIGDIQLYDWVDGKYVSTAVCSPS